MIFVYITEIFLLAGSFMFLGIGIRLYVSAKRQSRRDPAAVSSDEIRKRRRTLIWAVVLAAVTLGLLLAMQYYAYLLIVPLLLILLFATPLVLLPLLVVSICRYVSAKRQNRRVPGTHSEEAVRGRGHMLVVASILLGMIMVFFVTLQILLMQAIAYM